MGVYSSRAALAASWAAWVMASGVGRGVRCRGAGGAWGPVVRGGRSAVQRGRVRLLCMVSGLGCVLRSAWAACLGCWRHFLASSLAVIVAAGGPRAVGVLSLFGFLPQVHSTFPGAWRGISRR